MKNSKAYAPRKMRSHNRPTKTTPRRDPPLGAAECMRRSLRERFKRGDIAKSLYWRKRAEEAAA